MKRRNLIKTAIASLIPVEVAVNNSPIQLTEDSFKDLCESMGFHISPINGEHPVGLYSTISHSAVPLSYFNVDKKDFHAIEVDSSNLHAIEMCKYDYDYATILKALQEIKQKGNNVIIFWNIFEAGKPAWVVNYKNGKEIFYIPDKNIIRFASFKDDKLPITLS